MPADPDEFHETLINLTSDIVSAHVSHNSVDPGKVPQLIATVYNALASVGTEEAKIEQRPEAAISVRASVKPDYVVCLEDGQKFKMLKRHLMTNHGLTPDQYRARWNLPANYPIVAPNYAKRRSELAKAIGLGSGRKTKKARGTKA